MVISNSDEIGHLVTNLRQVYFDFLNHSFRHNGIRVNLVAELCIVKKTLIMPSPGNG